PQLGRMSEVFPIAAWYIWEHDCVYNRTHVDDEQAARDYYEWTMADLARLGTNTIMADWTPRDHRHLVLDAAERNDIGVIVHLDEVNDLLWSPASLRTENFVPTFRDAVDTAKDHPATLGYYMVDEPAPTPENIANTKMARQLLQALDPEHPGFSCLNWGWEETFPQVGCEVLLVDIYPVYWNRLEGEVLDGYIAALDRAHRAAGDSPLWLIPQCFGFGGSSPHGIPAPNEVSLMAWEGIAHGAKGIMYFLYQSTTDVQGEWLRGIVDERLQPMDHRYNEVRRLNAALAAVADTLLQLRRDPVQIASAQEGIDVQALTHSDGTPYLCVVNQATDASVDADLRFEPGHADQIANVVDVGSGQRLGGSAGATVPLGPGEGKLLRLAP
ncbi:MAG TPA: beta-galactosidase, partial [Armatimonadota bacterium]|nr:beta-galactosidase [Armatimonadota bacterium]